MFLESVVQYVRVDICVPPRGSPQLLQFKILKVCNLDLVEGRPRSKLGEYKFDKAADELRPKYGSSEISNNDVFVEWKDYGEVYGDVAHQLPTNLFFNPMKEGEEVEVEVGPGNLSLI